MVSSDYQTFGQSILLSMKEVFQNQEIIVPKIKLVDPVSAIGVEKGVVKKKMTTICSKTKKIDVEYMKDKVYARSTKNEKNSFKFPEIQTNETSTNKSLKDLSMINGER